MTTSEHLIITKLPNSNIYSYKSGSSTWTSEALAEWEASIYERVKNSDGLILSIYDLQDQTELNFEASAIANRVSSSISSHPNRANVYAAAVIKSHRIAVFMNGLYSMTSRVEQVRIFSDWESVICDGSLAAHPTPDTSSTPLKGDDNLGSHASLNSLGKIQS